MFRLIYEKPGSRKEYQIPDGNMILGRDKECDLHIDNPEVSRHHISLIRRGDLVMIRDLNSSNGTQVNYQKVEEAKLSAGDVVGLGKLKLYYDDGTLGEASVPEKALNGGAASASPSPEPAKKEKEKEKLPEGDVQPKLMQKSGKWFLKDPRTGKEVEIVAATAEQYKKEGAEVIEEVPLDKKLGSFYKKHKLLTIVGVAFIVLMFSAGLVKISMDGKKNNNNIPKPKISNEKFEAAVKNATDQFDRGNLKSAGAFLTQAQQAVPGTELVKTITAIMMALKNVLKKRDWNEFDFRNTLKNIEYADKDPDSSMVLKGWLSKWKKKINTERSAQGSTNDIRAIWNSKDYLKTIDACNKFVSDPSFKNTSWVRWANNLKKKALKAHANKLWRAAERYYNQGKMEFAREKYNDALKYADSGLKKRINGTLRIMNKTTRHKDEWKRVQKAKREGDEDALIDAVDAMSKDNPYKSRALKLKDKAMKSKDIRQAETAFRNMDGELAVRTIAKYSNDPAVSAIITKIEKTMKYLRLADVEVTAFNGELDEKRLDKAKEYCDDLIELISDEENKYRIKAQSIIDEWTDSKLAELYFEKATALHSKKLYKKAKEFFIKSIDKGGEGEEKLKKYERDAETLYNKGLMAATRGNKEKAVRYIKDALDLLREGSDKYKRYESKLFELGG